MALAQYLLVWTGDYVGLVDGVVGPQTKSAINGYFKRKKGHVPESLSEEDIDTLIRDAVDASTRSGFEIRRDRRLGITYGVPSAIFAEGPSQNSPLRKRFHTADGNAELEVAHLQRKYSSLDQLFRRLSNLRGRTVTYSVFQGSWFVISGRDGEKEFYVRYHGSGSEIRGFAISFTPSWAEALAPSIVAMSSTFRPSATASDPLIQFLDEIQTAAAEDSLPDATPGAPPKSGNKTGGTGSGFVVDSAGHVITNAHVVSDCDTIRIADYGSARVRAIDETNDLALLENSRLREIAPLVFRADRIRLGEEVVAAGYPLFGVLADGMNVTPGIISSLSGLGNDSRFLQTTAPIQPGNSGGPLVDRGARVVGIVTSKLSAVAFMEKGGFIPEGVSFAIRHDAIKPFLDSHHIESHSSPRQTDSLSVEVIAEQVRRSVVAIECLAQPT